MRMFTTSWPDSEKSDGKSTSSNRRLAVFLPASSYTCSEQSPCNCGQLLLFVAFAVLYVRAHPTGALISVAASLLRVPTVLEINAPPTELKDSFPWLKPFLGLLVLNSRMMWKRADALVVVTPEMGKWLEAHGIERPYVVVPNGADTEFFHPDAGSEDHGLSLPDNYVVFFGAFAAWQGIPTMLEAANLPEWPDNVRLLLAGDGALRESVKQAAAANDRIHYLGHLPHREIPALVANSIAALSLKNPSKQNRSVGMSPLKVYEALACATPVVVTDLPGQREVVQENSCGIVIPPEDPQALARAVSYLASHERERELMGARGRSTIENEHSWKTRAEATSQLLMGLAK